MCSIMGQGRNKYTNCTSSMETREWISPKMGSEWENVRELFTRGAR